MFQADTNLVKPIVFLATNPAIESLSEQRGALMEISLSEEHAYYFIPQLSPEIARDRIEKKKTTLVADML